MISYVDNHVIEFADQWGDKVVPQLEKVKYKDLTEVFKKTKRSRMILDAIADKKRIYVVGFKNCKGMIKKWSYDHRGRLVKEQSKGVVDINPSVITMAAVDINVPFVSSDEILLVKHHRDKPYNLEREIVEKAMIKAGYSPEKDILFMFFCSPSEAKNTIERFADEFRNIMTMNYCRAKGIIAIKDPKWTRYHASDEISKYTDAFFFNGVRLDFSRREARKREVLE